MEPPPLQIAASTRRHRVSFAFRQPASFGDVGAEFGCVIERGGARPLPFEGGLDENDALAIEKPAAALKDETAMSLGTGILNSLHGGRERFGNTARLEQARVADLVNYQKPQTVFVIHAAGSAHPQAARCPAVERVSQHRRVRLKPIGVQRLKRWNVSRRVE